MNKPATYLKKVHRRSTRWLTLLCILAGFMVPSHAQINEYDIKAMFLYNFLKYVEWPDAPQDNVYRVGVIGNSGITQSLERLAASKRGDARKIEIVRMLPGTAQACHILFVPNSSSIDLQELSRRFQGQGVLVVTEYHRAPEKGAGINLVNIDSKVRFEIYIAAIKQSGLKVSSQLSNLAVEVK